MTFRSWTLLGFITVTAVMAKAQRPPDSPDRNRKGASPGGGNYTNDVNIRISGQYRHVTANGIPDHTPGRFPNRNNPNSLRPQSYQFRLSMNPQINNKPTAYGHMPFGVALNGVPFDPAAAEFWQRDWNSGWQYEAVGGGVNLGLDEHNAHVQPTGAYHYHGMPMGLARKYYKGDGMVLVGYAADGFPIYARYGHSVAKDSKSGTRAMKSSWQLKQGQRPSGPGGTYDGTFVQDFEYVKGTGDLDECNGRIGVTPEYPKGIYHYYITDEFPFIPRHFRGTPDDSFRRRGPGPDRPGGPPGGGIGPPGRGGPRKESGGTPPRR